MENGRKTIFVVDDNTSSLEKARELLSDKYIVFTLNSGVQLFKLLEKVKPDLILLDVVMPKLNGYEVLGILKRNEDSADIPVILLTGLTNEDAELEGLSMGAIDYIVKPFSAPLLLKRIDIHLLLVSQKRELAAKMENELIQMKERQEEQRRVEIAEESNKAKSKFLARMSHEIRTPISAIMGISELQLRNPKLPATIGNSFGKIYNSAGLLLDIVNNILDLSSIESDRMTMLCNEYQTATLIGNIAQSHTVDSDNKDIKFSIDVDENIPSSLTGDMFRIEQIVSNLLSNAFKFTSSGFVELSFRSQQDVTRENYVTLIISVLDTGMGMAPEHLDTIYSEYARFHEQEKHFVEGAGLGLLIVYSLAQLMDAQIELESELGEGTRVTVHIPQKVAGPGIIGVETANKLQQMYEDARAADKKFEFTPEPMPNGSVLVVDDIKLNWDLARKFLDLYGIKCETCINGYEAIEKIKQGKVYDIILMDQIMPGMSGTETMQVMRDMAYTGPIVAFTAKTSMGHEDECLKDGFDGFLSKPLQTDKLDAILTAFIVNGKQ